MSRRKNGTDGLAKRIKACTNRILYSPERHPPGHQLRCAVSTLQTAVMQRSDHRMGKVYNFSRRDVEALGLRYDSLYLL